MHTFKLIRWKNLLIIAATQSLLRYAVIHPMLSEAGIESYFSDFRFFILVVSTMLVAAGGYVINDLFDQETDRSNKHGNVVIGKHISTLSAWKIYFIVNAIALVGTIYTGYVTGRLLTGLLLYFSCLSGLYLYSMRMKSSVLVGNLMISGFSALVMLIVWLAEFLALKQFVVVHGNRQIELISLIVLGYSVFAFLVSMQREIVKDAEDMSGDKAAGLTTFCVVHGLGRTRKLTTVFSVSTMLLLAVGQAALYNLGLEMLALWYILVQGLMVYFILVVARAAVPSDFRLPSMIAKAVMVTGVLGMQLFMLHQP